MAVIKSSLRMFSRGKYKLYIILILTISCFVCLYLWQNTPDIPLERSELSISDRYERVFLSSLRETFSTVLRVGVGLDLPRNSINVQSRPKSHQNVSGLACKMPDLKPFDWSIRHLIEKPNVTQCDGRRLTYMRNGSIFLNHSNVAFFGDINYEVCRLVEPVRESDDLVYDTVSMVHHFHGNTSKLKEDVKLDLNITSDFFTVVCSDSSVGDEGDEYDYTFRPSRDEYLYEDAGDQEMNLDAFAHIFPHSKALKRAAKQLKKKHKSAGLGLNVMMLGVDSTSRMNFLRCMPKSYQFMKEKLGAIVLKGYNIVADATTGALIPMLTGETEEELPEVRRNQRTERTVDVYPTRVEGIQECWVHYNVWRRSAWYCSLQSETERIPRPTHRPLHENFLETHVWFKTGHVSGPWFSSQSCHWLSEGFYDFIS